MCFIYHTVTRSIFIHIQKNIDVLLMLFEILFKIRILLAQMYALFI